MSEVRNELTWSSSQQQSAAVAAAVARVERPSLLLYPFRRVFFLVCPPHTLLLFSRLSLSLSLLSLLVDPNRVLVLYVLFFCLLSQGLFRPGNMLPHSSVWYYTMNITKATAVGFYVHISTTSDLALGGALVPDATCDIDSC